MERQNIAIVGAGIAGLTAAHRLHPHHDVTVFEANDYVGGHTNTIDVSTASGDWSVDTGFIVLNDRNYPNFTSFLGELGVAIQSTHMGFSVASDHEDFEYAGTPRGLVAQPRNLTDPRYYRMIRELLRFNREMRELLESGADGPSLGEYLDRGGYGEWFVHRLIVPQASAVWSADPAGMWAFPVRFLAEFFRNHGMLGFKDRPQWQTIVGGSARYVDAVVKPFADRVHVSSPIEAVTRHHDHVAVTPRGAESLRFDEVVLACHADQARAMLTNPTDLEDELLAAFPFQANEAVLHTDSRLLPRRRACHQAWNFHLLEQPKPLTTITYGMNHLQRLAAPEDFLVTLNLTEKIDPAKIIRTISYAHPVFTREGVAAQARHGEISGADRIHYAGAYWRWGFHEDGVVSALNALEQRGRHARAKAGVA
ncbi:MAG: FAD-dependent oxidoreductase [Solirubrobacterales bacterium]|nr:FAD-dependent oxidoreductase [Solirubrobacterales bacterium]